ncbi:PBSX family phage terminase large subunit [Listeria booriae]|uniref:PBSX family phage terminase large subunit n=1 Tax=Listeria booriae TaxID=1552123 RepID=UPI00164E7B0E|nr:PBSX family phage terminase large subunit [Listeria booriae]MBC6150105.1 PBSX family phage terminase large subunit [Listeria booriae]
MLLLSDKQKENIYTPLEGVEMELNEGTIRSGKTLSDAQKMAIIYAASPDMNHLVSAYNQEQAYRMFMDCEGKGLVNIFKNVGELRSDRHGDHLWLNLPSGEKKIYYKGGGKANSVGAITGMSFGTVTFLEFNLLHKSFIEESFRRTLAAKFRYHLAEQNPPAPNHANLETLEPFIKTGKYRFRHWRPHDNPILTGPRLADWEEQCKTSDYLYKRDWLGQRVMPEGVIYNNFDPDIHTKNVLQGKVVEAFFSADGGQSDATTCSFNVVTQFQSDNGKYNFRLYRMANYYHSGKDTGSTKAMSTYAKEIVEFKNWCFSKWGYHHDYFFVDPACKSLREELHLLGVDTDRADNNAGDTKDANGLKLEVGIERAKSCIDKGLFYLYDGNKKYDHYHFIKEAGLYARNENGTPADKDNHAMDEFRYSINYFFKNYIKVF